MYDLTIILVSYNTAHLLEELFDKLNASIDDLRCQIIIVDNASNDDSIDKINELCPCALILTNKINVGFGRANNQAIPHIQSEYVLLLNTDAFVKNDTLVETLKYMQQNPECGVLGVKLIGRDGVLQPSCRYFPTPVNIFLNKTGLSPFFPFVKMVDNKVMDFNSVSLCDWVPGCYYLTRKSIIDNIGLFDKRYFLYNEEVDHCFAVKAAGWQVHYYPHTTVIHLGGESAKAVSEVTESGAQIQKLHIESELLYFRKNHGLLSTLLHIILVVVSDLINLMKSIVKGNGAKAFLYYYRYQKTFWRIVIATRCGKFSLH